MSAQEFVEPQRCANRRGRRAGARRPLGWCWGQTGLAAVHSALHMADTIGGTVDSLVGWASLGCVRITSATCALRRKISASVINLMRASSQAVCKLVVGWP
jgi:hypothetical protein